MAEDTKPYTVDSDSTTKSDEWAKFLNKVIDTTTTTNGDIDLCKIEEAVRLANSIINSINQMCASEIISTTDAQSIVSHLMRGKSVHSPIVGRSENTESFLIEFSRADREFIDAIWCYGHGSDKVGETAYLHKRCLKYKILLMLYGLSNRIGFCEDTKIIPNDSISIPPDKVPCVDYSYS